MLRLSVRLRRGWACVYAAGYCERSREVVEALDGIEGGAGGADDDAAGALVVSHGGDIGQVDAVGPEVAAKDFLERFGVGGAGGTFKLSAKTSPRVSIMRIARVRSSLLLLGVVEVAAEAGGTVPVPPE